MSLNHNRPQIQPTWKANIIMPNISLTFTTEWINYFWIFIWYFFDMTWRISIGKSLLPLFHFRRYARQIFRCFDQTRLVKKSRIVCRFHVLLIIGFIEPLATAICTSDRKADAFDFGLCTFWTQNTKFLINLSVNRRFVHFHILNLLELFHYIFWLRQVDAVLKTLCDCLHMGLFLLAFVVRIALSIYIVWVN